MRLISSSLRPARRAQARRRRRRVLHRELAGAGRRSIERELEADRRALADHAVQAHAAAHQLHQALADRQPQAGNAAMVAARRVLDLEEGLEDRLLLRLGMPMPVSLTAKAQPQPLPGPLAATGTTDTVTSPSSVNLIALPSVLSRTWLSLRRSPTMRSEHLGGDVAHQRQTHGARHKRLQRQHVVDHLGGERKGSCSTLKLAGLQAREAEHVLQRLRSSVVLA